MKRLVVSLATFIFLLFSSTANIRAQVIVNEISPASSPEWVELYNPGESAVSLFGYSINFGSESQTKNFCDNDQILANSYKLVSLTASWLNNDGDTVTLKSGANVLDTISYGSGSSLGKPNSLQSATRPPDGSANWIVSDTPTQQGEVSSFDCPTPTPTSVPTPVPTNPPTATPTPSPTKTPTPKPTAKPTVKPTSTPEPTGEVLSETSEPKTSPSPEVIADELESNVPIIAFVLIFLGILSIGGAFYPFLKSKLKAYNENNAQNN